MGTNVVIDDELMRDALPATGGIVRIPAGTYEMSAPILIGKSDVRIEGAGTATHIVNGRTNNRVTGMKQMVDDAWVPLTKGKIALQLEGAEVFYRNIELKLLKP